MANILSKQYSSVFSTPRVTLQDAKSFFDDTETENSLHNIVFAEDDIIAAIDELSNNSAAGPDGFPAVMLKKLKHVLAKPLLAIWRQSLDEGICPNQAKQSTITPLHKGKSTAHAANYRPVTLTSHLVKIFEKVLRKHVVSHLEKNNLFNNTQHGFRAGRSCLSQLLSHDKILSLLDSSANVYVIYLDFAKAFDKLDFSHMSTNLRKTCLCKDAFLNTMYT